MRSRLLLLLFALVAAPCCTLWDPDYQPSPDQVLRDLLAPVESGETPLDPVERDRLSFAVAQLATRFPRHVPSQVTAAALVFERGEAQRAQGFVDRALSLEPSNVEARCLRARIAVGDGSLDLARKVVDEGLRLRPDAPALYESSAWIYQLDGDLDAAIRALDAAESLQAPGWRVTYHRGLVEEQRGNFRLARKHYEAAIEANEDCNAARQRLAGLTAKARIGRK